MFKHLLFGIVSMSDSSIEPTEEHQHINHAPEYGQKIYRPETGHIIDQRYKLLRKIGEGGMGYVYRAEQLNINRNVVIKLLKPEFCVNDEQLNRFKREAELASKLSHPNCVTIHDFGFHQRAPYIVMEYLEGKPLSELMFYTKERLPLDEISHYIGQVCDALSVAQDLGVVHRDLKPENIFVLAEPQGGLNIKVLDFGIAKLAHTHPEASTSNLTRGDMVFGTPQYMAPEQIRGKPLDHRADVYALTVILFEMLTGKVPFDNSDPSDLVSILTQHLRDPIPQLDPQKLHPDAISLCGALNQIIQVGMAKKPDDRLNTTQDLKQSLALLVEPQSDIPPKRPTADTLPNLHQKTSQHSEEGRVQPKNKLSPPQIEPSLTGDDHLNKHQDELTHSNTPQQSNTPQHTLKSVEKKKSLAGSLFKSSLFIALLGLIFIVALTFPLSPLKNEYWQAKRAQLPDQVQLKLDRFEHWVTPHMSKVYKAIIADYESLDQSTKSQSAKKQGSKETDQQVNKKQSSEGQTSGNHSDLGQENSLDKSAESNIPKTENKIADEQDEQVGSNPDQQSKELNEESSNPKGQTTTQATANTSNKKSKDIAVMIFKSTQDCSLQINRKAKRFPIKNGIAKTLPIRFGKYTLTCVSEDLQECTKTISISKRKKYMVNCEFK